ncbi:5860_t:CDS:2, partial [Ambispora leptoticha]
RDSGRVGDGGESSNTNQISTTSTAEDYTSIRQSRVMEVTAMMQGEDGPADDGNATEHPSRNPFN